ncbi:MAG TPA: threonine/serine exporter family protein [Mobilitalea sp.]|nr:threonine/serine exporter family protein [Mobilitalea sp.]
MNYILLYKTAMLAGEIMARSGAETFRVEDTMVRILKTSEFQSIDVHATTTGIMATLADPSIEPITGVKRISDRSNNLSRISEVNQISRDICDGKMTIEDAYEKLHTIKEQKIYKDITIAVATLISTGCFVGLFGGNITDFFIATVNGSFIVLISIFFKKRVTSAFISDAVKSFAIAFFTMLGTYYLKDTHAEIIIIGSIMPLVPGIPITNAVRDTLQGDYMSGTARAAEAFVISIGIAVGVGFGMGFFNFFERMLY